MMIALSPWMVQEPHAGIHHAAAQHGVYRNNSTLVTATVISSACVIRKIAEAEHCCVEVCSNQDSTINYAFI
jgi:hypothetical protein